MGLLDSLNPINLVKTAAESIVDTALPDSLKSVGNDLVDVALDVVSGNYGSVGKDVSSFLHDAETAMAPLINLATSLPSTATEPDAPPASSDKKTSDTKPSDAKTTTPASTSSESGSTKTTGETAPTTTPIVTQGEGSTTAPDKTTGTTGSKSTSKSTSSSSTSKSTSSSDAKDVTKFFAQSDTDLMAAVRDGKLPDAVKDDPAAMQRLQLRMNEISEMNQLISQMLAAMHDMNKAVIQNIRA